MNAHPLAIITGRSGWLPILISEYISTLGRNLPAPGDRTMGFVEAFEKLGYIIEAQRQDWTAEKPDGVCISLWRKEMGSREGMLWMDTHEHADPIENWGKKPGNQKRIRHLKRSLAEFDGKVDVVIVSGEPGVSYGTAQPWIAEGARAGTFWQVTSFDAETGHFTVELRREASAA